jgi:superfamily II DNA or RNA helicase
VEISQTVRVRRQQWRVAGIRSFETCQLVTLANRRGTRHLLTPFDDVEAVATSDRPLLATARRWRRACRALLAADTPPGALRTAASAAIELLPHQLEPALAVLRGVGSRVLLADDVGLGKTIQAGLIVAELLIRHAAERVLILTPAGVRDQWADELRTRFGMIPAHADAVSLRQLGATLPIGVNPWQTMPLAIASIDYVKQLEVLPSVRRVRWDVVVVDEAHTAAGDSERRDAVRMLAGRAAFVVLLTATPHSGDDAAFHELCRIGAVDDSGDRDAGRLVVFRRKRTEIRGDRSRRIHVLRVRSSVAERHMHAALARYRMAVEAEHGNRALALSVLEKRALSSPWSLAQSVDRRLASLAEPALPTDLQLALPLGDPDGEQTDDDAPPWWPSELGLADKREDRRLLMAVAGAAKNAALHGDSKLRRLRRVLNRVHESALIFTEYRDTAIHLAATVSGPALLLHGSMSRVERTATVERFTRTPGTILFATDAAGQGLNLHQTCRLVINVELPWNPMRLEQRIGRVDRIGQTRIVHAVHLVASDTHEISILSRLKTRVTRARTAIDAPDPIGVTTGFDLEDVPTASVTFAEQRDAARTEVDRCKFIRAIATEVPNGDAERFGGNRPLLIWSRRRRRLRRALAGRTLLLYRLECEDGDGRIVESCVVPLLVDDRLVDPTSTRIPAAYVERWRRQVDEVVHPFHTARIARASAIASVVSASPISLFQPALFDRRAEHAHRQAIEHLISDADDANARLVEIGRQAIVGNPTARLQLLVRP